ncbi:MAG: 1-(5-phosphoribosyl)-5-[(5-phosphoribosylamino)methylideneamino]imidazole-4-carboxamide isomerase [Myxococcales bacterium]|nr:1-(5-phosphoribosyl)-5-[(5-phosphoribosylamino)methylideneamino]imidazole-4-carboxamide isomerase [Myxococcales bacterium]
MKLYPAIDLLDGKVVRLREGKRDEVTMYGDDPVAVAQAYRDAGAAMIHVVDLNGAFDQSDVQLPLVADLIAKAGVAAQVGGGIRSLARAAAYVAQGCSRVVIGTAALDENFLEDVCAAHPGRVVVAVDAKDGMVATHGWTQASGVTALALAQRAEAAGAAAVLYTDVARDGTGVGPNVEATAALQTKLSIEVIASGGIGALEHLQALAAHGVQASVIGRALFEKQFSFAEAMALVG